MMNCQRFHARKIFRGVLAAAWQQVKRKTEAE